MRLWGLYRMYKLHSGAQLGTLEAFLKNFDMSGHSRPLSASQKTAEIAIFRALQGPVQGTKFEFFF